MDNNAETIPVNVTIADRTYRVRVLPNNEEDLRKTVKLINDKVVEFKTLFAGRDMQDYIAMVILWYATQSSEEREETGQIKGIQDQLQLINDKLGNALDQF